jgi:hypothetical protein
MIENYTSLPAEMLNLVCGLLLASAAWAPMAWLIVLLIPVVSPPRSTLIAQAVLLIAGSYLLILFWRYAPGDFMSWVLD